MKIEVVSVNKTNSYSYIFYYSFVFICEYIGNNVSLLTKVLKNRQIQHFIKSSFYFPLHF